MSLISKDAILYAGQSKLVRRSTALSSNGEENSQANFVPGVKSSECHAKGVCASLLSQRATFLSINLFHDEAFFVTVDCHRFSSYDWFLYRRLRAWPLIVFLARLKDPPWFADISAIKNGLIPSPIFFRLFATSLTTKKHHLQMRTYPS